MVDAKDLTECLFSTGLHFMLNVEQKEYFGEFTKNAGIKVYIGMMSFPNEEGINVAPGLSTFIGLTQVQLHFIVLCCFALYVLVID